MFKRSLCVRHLFNVCTYMPSRLSKEPRSPPDKLSASSRILSFSSADHFLRRDFTATSVFGRVFPAVLLLCFSLHGISGRLVKSCHSECFGLNRLNQK